MKKPRISIIAAIGTGRTCSGGLGKDGKLLWHIPDDLKRFKALTYGHPVIMGRKTFESIVSMIGKPLPQRTTIVITRDTAYSYPGVTVVHSLEDALTRARETDEDEVFIGGGGEIYTAALPFVDKLYLTLVDGEKEADSYFPNYEGQFTREVYREDREWNGLKYHWIDLER